MALDIGKGSPTKPWCQEWWDSSQGKEVQQEQRTQLKRCLSQCKEAPKVDRAGPHGAQEREEVPCRSRGSGRGLWGTIYSERSGPGPRQDK